jgi:Zn-finger nucleic acid-binding protein
MNESKKVKIICPKCNVQCNPYGDYKSVGRCPKCSGLFTTSSGDDLTIVEFKIPEKRFSYDEGA